MAEYSLIGKSVPRIDTPLKATGDAVFTADIKLPRMLCAGVLRSPHAHARILSIDTTRAEKVPGVKAVITHRDTKGVKWGVFRYTRDQLMLPIDKVRYVGEEVAAVAATDLDTALHAAGLIDVDYEVLPAVFDPPSALAEGAPQLHDDFPGNLNVHVHIDVGDVEAGFKESYLVREDTFTSEEESYFMTEPYAVVASYDAHGNLEVWMPNAAPHQKAKALSNALEIPLNRVAVRKCYIGGAFGGRSDVFPGEYIASLLSIKTGRPVKLVYTREENTIATRQGHSMIFTVKTGVDPDGKVIARDMTCYMDGGAYSSTAGIATSVPCQCLEQTYRMPNMRYNGYRVYTNKPVRGMIRVHGRAFAGGVDLQLDMMAEELGIDPVEMRRRNARRAGEVTPTGSKVQSCGLIETIDQAAAAAGWAEKYGKLPRWRGIGIGNNSVQTGFPLGIRGGSQAFVKFNEDGGATVISGVVDNGQGNDNMLVQIAAEILGLPMDEVQLISADTEVTANDPGAYSMQATFTGGNAVRLAAEDAREQIFEIASEALEANQADLRLRDRMVYVEGAPDKGLPLAKVIRMGLIQDRPVMGKGAFAPKVDHRREWVKNPKGQLSETFSFGTTIVEVEVDPETGRVKVLNAVCAQDCGHALNPAVVEGQFEGGFAMGGQGGMLTEAHRWAGGHCLNPTMLDYKLPLTVDMPPITPIIVESEDPTGPFGAKEAGMSVAMSAAQAYASAIRNATGITFSDFPITPEKIVKALKERGVTD